MAKLIGICRAKNEADFIEYFVRHNAEILDELYIVDDQSSDNTAEIVENLANENLVTELLHINDRRARICNLQGEVMTQLMNYVAGKQLHEDWFLWPLDADEIILGKRKYITQELDLLGEDEYGLIRWKTFVPIEGGLNNGGRLRDKFKPKSNEHIESYKAVIHARHTANSSIEMGNHRIISRGAELHPRTIKIELGHFPVRSASQITSKSLIATHKTQLKGSAACPNENYHIKAIASRIRHLGYKITDIELTGIALNYLGGTENCSISTEFDESDLLPEIKPIYPQRLISPIAALDNLLQDIIAQNG